MKYLKVFTDLIDQLEEYGDAERGRLFTAMLEYARSAKEPEFRGNERFIWKSLKASIDRDRDTYDRMADRARSVAQARAASVTTRHRNDIERHRNDIVHGNNDIVQDKDKDKDKEYITPLTPLTVEMPDGGGGAYVADNLRGMSTGNWEELRSFLDDGLPMELVHHAVDEAAAHGTRTWAYVRRILNRYQEQGVSTVQQAKNTDARPHPSQPESGLNPWYERSAGG